MEKRDRFAKPRAHGKDMAESKKKRKTSDLGKSGEGARPPETTGETLRAARIQRGVGLEEISAAVNIRVGQLRAIEEGNLDGLPGMTYAIGFVKSYASYLKLNTNDIVQKFKEEHGVVPVAQSLHMPEPLADGPRPNMLVIGIAAFCGFLVLFAWTVFSGGETTDPTAGQIPPAPAVGTVTGIAPAPQDIHTPPPPTAPVVAATEQAPAAREQLASSSQAEQVAGADSVAEPVVETVEAVTPGEEVQPATEEEVVVVAQEEPRGVKLPIKPDREALRRKAELFAQQQQQQETIQIRSGNGKSRIVLSAKQSTWVEVANKKTNEKVLAKVMRPGEQFAVPDQPGLSLVTTNAGGLEVFVDGEAVQSLGARGEIVSGVELDPEDLKIVRQKASRQRR